MDAEGSLSTATREVFGNISPWMRVVFYVMIYASLGVLGWQVWSRARLWRMGKPGGFERDWRLWARRLLVYGAAQRRVHRKSLGAALHLLLFSGFCILTLGTTLLAIAHQGPINFHHGWYYLFYELTLDFFGVGFCIGCGLALYRRLFHRPAALGHRQQDFALLGLLLAIGVTGFAVESLRLHYSQVPTPIARWSLVGHILDVTLLGKLSPAAARPLHLAFWWGHAILVAAFFVSIPVTRFLHVLTGPVNIAVRPARALGALAPVDLAQVEASGKLGVAALADFTRQQLLSLDACMECGRCEEACPAWASGKPLSPKAVVVNLREALPGGGSGAKALHGGVITADTLWACTMCQACVSECPVLIGHVDMVSDMRRHLVAEGQFSGPPARALSQIGRQFNPYGQPAQDRMAWANGLKVPTVESNPDFDCLFWVGCAPSYDPRAQKVARAFVRLLQEAGVNFAVLGREERCTGDAARRMGDELLFLEGARANIQTLNARKVKQIVTTCPHCLNTLKNEYPQFGGNYEVKHHSQLLAELLAAEKLRRQGDTTPGEVTFHDPCYLARVNEVVSQPRAVLAAATGRKTTEMSRHGAKTFCCGAGGGRMWFEEPASQRVSHLRAKEALSTGAGTLATACPFCLNMMNDAMASLPGDDAMQVKDIAEILLESCVGTPAATAAAS
jgi:Fe-S oxidoreductase/nitrate reductase gamma subunit